MKRGRKKPYPRDSDIRDAIIRTLYLYPLVKPYDFAEKVMEVLEEEGYYTGLVNVKRVWRVYEKMVLKGEIYDYLDVVKKNKAV